MSDKYYRSTVMNVDLEAITHNYQSLDRQHPDKIIMPVVKANSYGLGSIAIANHLKTLGATFFCVATLDEAIELRMHGIREKILILSSIPPYTINKAIQHRVAIAVPSKEWLIETISHVDDSLEKKVWLHIKLDTGMNRLGVKDAQTYQEIIEMIHEHPNFEFEGAFSHFASADEDNQSSQQQYERFEALIESAERPAYIHVQNSAGTLRFDTGICTAFRPGIALYGYYPTPFIEAETDVSLKPAVRLVTEVTQVKAVQAGETIGYGETYTAQSDMHIALLPIGYADGFLRNMQGAFVSINGQQCEVVGRVSMDQTAVHVPEETKIGDEVVILEQQAHHPQSLETIAEQQHTINYEVLCNFGRRIPRIYQYQQNYEISNELLK
ncbi:alanine racemase [Staphylococcus canis]|uniref:Alanine racemase n=1 Tax=Staphylococcus canis TaxID=2724942 RepID=A0ABS0T9T6_9STAP|nr:alanine racemase [Staphylococcus canis]MBI5975489.1 alanine racemase [Staphylococcus canis]